MATVNVGGKQVAVNAPGVTQWSSPGPSIPQQTTQPINAPTTMPANPGYAPNPEIFMQNVIPTSTIPVNQTNGQTALNLAGTIPPPTDNATPMVAGAKVATKDIATTIAESTKPQTAEQIAAKAATDELSGLYAQDTGQKAATAAEEAALGVPGMTKQLNDINSEINIKNAEYDQLNTDIEGKPIPLVFQTGQKAQVAKQRASEIGLLVARAQAVQGNLTLAKESAAKAVDLKYEAVEDQIKVKLAQLALLKPTLDKQDAAQADFLAEQHKAELDKIAEEKAKTKDYLNISLSNQVKTPYTNYLGTWFNSRTGEGYATPEDFYKASGYKSFAEAYAAGGVTDVSGIPAAKKTQIVEANGRKLLIDEMTGATIRDLGYAGSGVDGEKGSITFTGTDKQKLLSAGFTTAEINNIQSDVNKYGIDKVVSGMSSAQASAVRGVLGGGTQPFLNEDFFKTRYGSGLEAAAKAAGYIYKSGGFLGNNKNGDTSAFISHLMTIVEQYRKAGYNDQDILKMMQ